MDRYGYVLKKGRDDKKETNRYHRADLMLMTTFQLRELCSKEKSSMVLLIRWIKRN